MKLKKKYKIKQSTISRSLFLLIILISAFPCTPVNTTNYNFADEFVNSEQNEGEDSILWKLGKGFPGFGATMQPKIVNFTNNGNKYIIIGTDGGLASVSLDGLINCSYNTFGPVIDFDLIEDISGDGLSEIILISYTQDYANVIAITSNNGSEIWKFKPTIRGIDQDTYKTQEFITYTWDIEIINDINNDFISDIAVSSWFRLFVISGKTGEVIWKNEVDFKNDIWKLAVIDDINNNGFETILAGSEEGKLIAFDSKYGTKLWAYKVAETSIRGYGIGGLTTYKIPNSIDEIKVVDDINDDNIDDILVAADDGVIRLLSGAFGTEFDEIICYNVTIPQSTYSSPPSSPYSSVDRIFRMSGIKILEIPDLDDDGNNEYLSIACDLDYPSDYYYVSDSDKLIQGRIFGINSESGLDFINVFESLNWSNSLFYSGSSPLIIEDDDDLNLYFYKRVQQWDDDYIIVRYSIEDKTWTNGMQIYAEVPDQSHEDNPFSDCNECYLCDIMDPNNDIINYVFAIGVHGHYLLIDTENDEIIWDRSKQASTIELEKIQDLNYDGIDDFLIQQKIMYNPEWLDPSQTKLGGEKSSVISNLFAIDGTSGKTLWDFNVPSPSIYDGLRDLITLDDINDDNIGDYAGWIIPSKVPNDISTMIKQLSGQEIINNEKKVALYRAFLCKYTKLIVIDGSNGNILWNTPLIDFPYKFYRHFEYNGLYVDPVSVDIGDYQIFNRINGKIPNSWVSGYDIDWMAPWDISTLIHANNITNVKGQSTGTVFDTWGEEGQNYAITSHNSSSSSSSIKIGTTLDSTSIGTIESDDNQVWIIDSTSYGDDHMIRIDLSFNQSIDLESELKYITVDYVGSINPDIIEKYDILIYNYSNSGSWKRISPTSINSSSVESWTKTLYDVDEVTIGTNNLVKLRIEASNSSAFSLTIDKLIVKYVYTHQNYTIDAENDDGLWKSVIDLEIPIDLSDEDLLGIMEYPLSQIDRLSALKLQTNLKVNTSDSVWYNFTYEIYDGVNKKWILCNWSRDSNTWNNHTYMDLKGDYYETNRKSYLDFEFNEYNYRNDRLWLLTRGTNDADPCVEFDYENKTTLSNFITSNKEIRIRLNITNPNFAFKVILDSFGIGTFYWGLFNNEYDASYLWKYEGYYENFDTTNILDLEVQDFKKINGNGDVYDDILVVIGNEDTWSTRIRLFDVKNGLTYEKWDIGGSILPLEDVRVLSLNSSINNFILTGIFSTGSNNSCSHKLVTDPHWNTQLSHFDNYSSSLISLDYGWEYTPYFPSYWYEGIPYEFPGKVNITKTGRVGILIGEYGEIEYLDWTDVGLTNIQVIDVVSKEVISIIPTENIIGTSQDIGKMDFSIEDLGICLQFAADDFNGDNFLDHIAMYMNEPVYGYEYVPPSVDIKVINGNNEGSNIIGTISFEDMYAYGLGSSKLPVSSIGDINNDDIPDLVVGLQSSDYDCKGSMMQFFDIFNNQQITEATWELESLACVYSWGMHFYEFFTQVKSIEDINLDGYSELLIQRKYSIKSTDTYGYSSYTKVPTTEIIDVLNKQILYRFNLDIDSLQRTSDLNGDGKNELIIVSDELVYCINSKFNVEIVNPRDESTTSSNNFEISWETGASYDYFEVFVDTVSQGPTSTKNTLVSLSSGWKEISVVMHDVSGLIISISTIRAFVPANYIYLSLTIALVGITIGVLIFYRKYSKKKRNQILIPKENIKGGVS